MVLQLELSLKEATPRIWRRILADDTTTLHGLHRIIQILMGWWDYHLYRFDVEGRWFVDPQDEPEFLDEEIGDDASTVTLRELGLRKGDVFDYEYDFGDSWEVEIRVERRRQTRGRGWILPWLLEGERAGPPEDCGGVPGFHDILEALDDPPPSPDDDLDGVGTTGEEEERRALLEWVGDYDPARFDRRTVNQFLVLAGGWGLLDR